MKLIDWFTRNHVAANLMMLAILFGGAIGLSGLNRESFPNVPENTISVSVAYPGADPAEVENRICIRIEEAIHDLTGIKKIRSTAEEGYGVVNVDVLPGHDVQKLLNEVKSRVDGISTFPTQSERADIREAVFHPRAVSVALSGPLSEQELKKLGKRFRDELSELPGVSVVTLNGTRPYEVSIEVSEVDLRRYNLTLEDVSQAVSRASLNLPAGTIKTVDGHVQLRTSGQAYNALDFEKIVLLRNENGTRVLVGDIAKVTDGFQEDDSYARFNGSPAIFLEVNLDSKPNITKVSKAVHEYAAKVQPSLPPGVELKVWRDGAVEFNDRISMLGGNAVSGLLLVFGILALLLRPALAIWVSAGIAVAFMGTFWILYLMGVSLNMISLFGFLLILGIVVDDAIIVGESVHLQRERGVLGDQGSIVGTQLVAKPIFFSALTTIITFSPILLLSGQMAKIAMSIPIVVIITLIFSLLEAFFILPSHLSKMKKYSVPKSGWAKKLGAFQNKASTGLTTFANNVYRPFLDKLLRYRYMTAASFFVGLLIVLSVVVGGHMSMKFMPKIVSDSIFADLTLTQGIQFEKTLSAMKQIEHAALNLPTRKEDPSLSWDSNPIKNIETRAWGNQVWINAEVDTSGNTDIAQVNDAWRKEIGEIPNMEQFNSQFTFNSVGKGLEVRLSASSAETLEKGAALLKDQLATYSGIYDITDSDREGKKELVLGMKQSATNMNLSLQNVAQQIRQSFYGREVQRIPREQDEVKVMVRYPKEERTTLDNLGDMRIRTPDGSEVPFSVVAQARYGEGYSQINRIDRKRNIQIYANIYEGENELQAIITDLTENYFPKWQQALPGLAISFDGNQEQEGTFMQEFKDYMIYALLIVYAMMAIGFRSYLQPLLVLIAVPFGFVGAVLGHALLGMHLSLFSWLGIIAVGGVVVNDNLVLLHYVNHLISKGESIRTAVRKAAASRFRPILMTSLTTFIGLTPLMFETSVQAQFMIPMVVSLAFGVLLATCVTLLFMPSIYLIGNDIRRGFQKVMGKSAQALPE